MKNTKKIIAIFIVLLMALSAVSCSRNGNSEIPPEEPAKVLELDMESVSLRVGETVTVTANLEGVFWESESNEIAVVIDGNITGISEGTTIVKATYERQVKPVTVIVSNNGGAYSAYPILAFESKASKIVKDYSFDLDACVMFGGEIVDDCQITFSSSDTGVLTVNENGTVTAVAAGTATVSASATYQGELLSESLTITVVDSVVFITFDNVGSQYLLGIGETFDIDATLKSFTETYDSSLIEWESSKPSVLSVQNGHIKGLNVGVATVNAKYDGAVLNSCNVEIERFAFSFELGETDLSSVTANFGTLSIVDYATENSDGKLDYANMNTEPYISRTAVGNMLKWSETGTTDTRSVFFNFGKTLAKDTKIKFKFFAYNPYTSDHFWFKLGSAVGKFTDDYYWSNHEPWSQYWMEYELTLSIDTDTVSFFPSYGGGMCSTNFGDPCTDRNALVYYIDDLRIVCD